MKFAGLVEYEGTGFSGWAAQPDRRTVEGELSRALETVLRQPVKMSVAGRTDAGVHASGQVVSFSAETQLGPGPISYRTTAILPEDVALRYCIAVPDPFDARRDARSRTYEYRIINSRVRSPLGRRQAIYVARRLNFNRLQRSASLVRGSHDFRAFTPSRTYHVRFKRLVTESFWRRGGDLLVYHVTADSFMYGMVRALIGTMLEVADRRRTLESFESLLSGGRREQAGPSVPSRGLTLTGVGYDAVRFERSSGVETAASR